MAENAVIGALRVALSADTGELEDGLKRGSDELKKFGRDVAAVAAGVGLEKFVEKLTESFVRLIKESIEIADQMGKLSQKIGIPVESLSSLTVAAKLADVTTEQLGKSMARLSKNMIAAAAGGTNDAAAAFQYLGISAKQLSTLQPDQVLAKISDKFAAMQDGANKTAVAIALFGRAGAEMIPLLNMGGKSMEEMTKTATALGLVISTQTAKQSEEFNDNLKLLGLSVQGVGLTVMKYFIPSMAEASKSMVKWVVDGNLVSKTAEVIVRSIVFVVDNLKVLGIGLAVVFGAQILKSIAAIGLMFIQLGVSIIGAAAASAILAARLLLTMGTVALVAAGILVLTGNLDKFLVTVEGLAKGTLPGLGDAGKIMTDILTKMGLKTDAFTLSLKDLIPNANATEEAIKRAFSGKNFDPDAAKKAEKLKEEINKLRLETQAAKGDFDLLAPGIVQAAIKIGILKEGAVGLTAATLMAMPGVAALNAELLKLALAKDMNPFDALINGVTRLSTAMGQQGVVAADAWSFAFKKAMGIIGQSMDKLATDMIGGWVELTAALGKNNKSMFQMSQALAIVQAIMSTYAGAAKALEIYGPTPIGFAAMAAAVAAGLAKVITIKQQKYTGAAAGGMFKVPGGNMGVDTKMVNMALAPGELVQVTPAGRAGEAGNRYLEIPAIRPDDFFKGDTVRAMVTAFDQWMRDGGTGIRMVPR